MSGQGSEQDAYNIMDYRVWISTFFNKKKVWISTEKNGYINI